MSDSISGRILVLKLFYFRPVSSDHIGFGVVGMGVFPCVHLLNVSW